MTQSSIDPHSPATPGALRDPDAARVWNYWFAHRDLSGAAQAVADPFADDYVLAQALWFRGGPEVDAEIAAHFEPLLRRAAGGELDAWRETPRECLALLILLDQFPRNIHRATAQAFAFDRLGLALAREALARGFDRPLAPAEALFFYMALTHSEQLDDVRAALAGIGELVTRCTRAQQRAARSWRVGTQKHIDVLERFGRYPHRNHALGRPSTPAEDEFLRRPEFTALFMRSQLPQPVVERAPEPARPEPVAAKPRLRILALHGFRQNGEVFRGRIRKLREALADVAELVFVSSPTEYSPQGDARDGTLAAFGEVPDYPMQRVWWLSSADNSEYQGFDASVAYLEAVFRERGPFDGVLGFAQGGTLAAVLAQMQPHPVIRFDFAVCISAFPSRASAHAQYLAPRRSKLPTLHVLGLGDILVTPDRSIALYETFDPATSALVQHAGGHFVPSVWPYPEIRAFVGRFGEAVGSPPATPNTSLLELACEALEAGTRTPPATIDVPLVQSIVQEMADQERWRELQAVAMHAYGLRGAEDLARPEASPLVVVHEEIVELFARALQAALVGAARIERRRTDADPERAARLALLLGPHGTRSVEAEPGGEAWPTTFAREAPRIGARADKVCRLARDTATAVFNREDMLDYIATRERERVARAADEAANMTPTGARRRARQAGDLETQARHLSYQRYSQALSCVAGVLADMDPKRVRDRLRKLRAARVYTSELLVARKDEPISRQVREPEPEPVVPCSLADLDPLLGHLRANRAVEQQTAFSKGTLTTDGRLDLCKQVVGPEGIGPLLGAMKYSDSVKRLLLGNNIVGDGGAAAIAGFLRERDGSPLDCWYIAGNDIGPRGIAEVCDALATDRKVRSLWLKRNPLKAAGMLPIAGLLRSNTTLEVLDLVNCGLLDEGLETVLGALMGPGANKTLRHLYIGTNGITERSAPLIAEFLECDCALESLFLSCNRLGDAGVEVIARGLAANRTIERVSLASNRVGPRGAAALADALIDHPSIALLDLGFTKATVAVGELGNFIGDDGARELARMLRSDTALRSLDLLHNYISQVGVNHLREAMKVNHTLVHLQLTQFGKVHNEPGKEELRAALQRNRERVPAEQAERVANIGLPDHITEIYSVYRTHS